MFGIIFFVVFICIGRGSLVGEVMVIVLFCIMNFSNFVFDWEVGRVEFFFELVGDFGYLEVF